MIEDRKAVVKLVSLNNKSRKGTYVYIKTKGQKGRHYKFTGKEGEIDAIKKYYQDSLIKAKPQGKSVHKYKKIYQKTFTGQPTGHKSPVETQAKRYIRTIKKKPMAKTMRKGIQTITINNIMNANNQTKKKINTELLKNLVIDQKLLEPLTKHENLKKIKDRFETRILIKNQQGSVLATATIFNKTPEEAIELTKKSIKPQMQVENGSPTIKKNLENRGFTNYKYYEEGAVNTVEGTFIIRKG